MATTIAARRGIGETVRAHVALTKPRIIELLLVTAVPTMFLAAQGLPTVRATIAVLVGGALAAGAANTFNSVYDRDIDAVMHRTTSRPAATGRVSVRAGFIQGLVLSALSITVLTVLANALSGLLALLAIVGYAVGYTMVLKRRTDQNIVWGGAAGCMPVLIAWSAITGSLTWTPVVLFAVIFFWTPPHYWPLAIKYRQDYQAAGIPMLPAVRGPLSVARHIVAYTWLMVAATLAGSSGSSGPGSPVRTLQKAQARVQVSPSTMNVAVPPSQHSPMLGQRASSQTVCRPRSRSVLVKRATVGPDGIGTFSQSGFLPGVMRLLKTDDIAACGAARTFRPSAQKSRSRSRRKPITYQQVCQHAGSDPRSARPAIRDRNMFYLIA